MTKRQDRHIDRLRPPSPAPPMRHAVHTRLLMNAYVSASNRKPTSSSSDSTRQICFSVMHCRRVKGNKYSKSDSKTTMSQRSRTHTYDHEISTLMLVGRFFLRSLNNFLVKQCRAFQCGVDSLFLLTWQHATKARLFWSI